MNQEKTNRFKFIWIAILIVCVGISYSSVLQVKKSKSEIPQFRNGDIIFQTSQSRQCQAVQLATHSPYSHVGMIYIIDDKTYVYEAIQPVCVTPIEDWIKRGKNDHYVVKRLSNAEDILNPEKEQAMKIEAEKYLGKNYDLYFEWSDERIYCSELVWKVYKEVLNIEVGELQILQSFDLSSPAVQQIMEERYGNDVPYDELVISPAAMFNADNLELIYRNN